MDLMKYVDDVENKDTIVISVVHFCLQRRQHFKECVSVISLLDKHSLKWYIALFKSLHVK